MGWFCLDLRSLCPKTRNSCPIVLDKKKDGSGFAVVRTHAASQDEVAIGRREIFSAGRLIFE